MLVCSQLAEATVNLQFVVRRLSQSAPQLLSLPSNGWLAEYAVLNLLWIGFVLGLLLVPEISHAQSFGRINTALRTLVDFMTGTTGRLLGILGVAGLGIAAWFGRLSYYRAGEIILGIAIVFGSAEIVDLFAR